MLVIKTHFDGKKVIIPEETRDLSPREVVLVFRDKDEATSGNKDMIKATESTFAKIWDNNEAAVYDSL